MTSADLTALESAVNEVLRTRRYLDWRQTREYADEIAPVVTMFRAAAEDDPSHELVELLQRALAIVLKVLLRSDDDGLLFGEFGELLEAHAIACDGCRPDPVKLAKWLLAATFSRDWFNPPDPVPYAAALGEKGLAVYRAGALKKLAAANPGDPYSTERFHGRYAMQRLAVIDRDPEAVIASFAYIERDSQRELENATAMREIGRADLALEHARAGLAHGHDFDRPRLTDLVDQILVEQGDTEALLELRREAHAWKPTRTTYAAVREAADALGLWQTERPTAIVVLGRANAGELVAVLLAEGRVDEAWTVYTTSDTARVREKDALALVKARAADHPSEALDEYLRMIDVVLVPTGQRQYEQAIRLLKKAVPVARRCGRADDLHEYIAGLRVSQRRRPKFIELLNRARIEV